MCVVGALKVPPGQKTRETLIRVSGFHTFVKRQTQCQGGDSERDERQQCAVTGTTAL